MFTVKEVTNGLDTPKFSLNDKEFVLESKFYKKGSEVLLSKQIGNYPRLSWTEVKSATSYEIQISSSSNFGSTVLRQTVDTPRFLWRNPQVGKFYARVRALSSEATGGYNKPLDFEVSLRPPGSLTSAEMHEEVPELNLVNSPPPPFELRWSPTVLTRSTSCSSVTTPISKRH
jgi:hypothetical protein